MIDLKRMAALGDEDLMRLLKHVETSAVVAIIAADAPVRDRVLGVAPNRAAALLRDEIELIGEVDGAQLDAARATAARQLREAVAEGDLDRRFLGLMQ